MSKKSYSFDKWFKEQEFEESDTSSTVYSKEVVRDAFFAALELAANRVESSTGNRRTKARIANNIRHLMHEKSDG